MKNLKDFINETLLDDFDKLSDLANVKDDIRQFLKDNYKLSSKFRISKKPNKDGLYEVDCKHFTGRFDYVGVINKNIHRLTNGSFVFINVVDFDCHLCQNLTSLEGAPEEVKGNFCCGYNRNLTSLKGAPKKVGDKFECLDCPNLTSLEGAPEIVGGTFRCNNCPNLKSLKGAPKEVKYDFNCTNCQDLTSLEGAPKKVGTFSCDSIFTEEDVKKVCNVLSGKINIYRG